MDGDAAYRRDHGATVGEAFVAAPKMALREVDVFYGEKQAIHSISLDIAPNQIIAMIGPSGCGKSTFLRCLNRMNDTIDGCVVRGSLQLDGEDIYDPALDVVPVSYTHLRAHETVLDLVCRLLLAKTHTNNTLYAITITTNRYSISCILYI